MGKGGTKKGKWGPNADLRHGLRETRLIWTVIEGDESRLEWFIKEGARQMSTTINKPISPHLIIRLVKKYHEAPHQFHKQIAKVIDEPRRKAKWTKDNCNASAVALTTVEPPVARPPRSIYPLHRQPL